MHNYSVKGVVDYSRRPPGDALVTDAVALLRSDLEIHKHFLRTFYASPK